MFDMIFRSAFIKNSMTEEHDLIIYDQDGYF